jgi:hypothetical protein
METFAESRFSARVELQLHDGASVKQYRELGLFVRDCISRIERTADRAESWTIKIVPSHVCFCADVIVENEGIVVQASGNGFDGAVAARDAFTKVENLLRENRPHDTEAVVDIAYAETDAVIVAS